MTVTATPSSQTGNAAVQISARPAETVKKAGPPPEKNQVRQPPPPPPPPEPKPSVNASGQTIGTTISTTA